MEEKGCVAGAEERRIVGPQCSAGGMRGEAKYAGYVPGGKREENELQHLRRKWKRTGGETPTSNYF